ncbi:kelch repeat-containing protein [Aquimarina sp. 2201CG5-10]|uniref:Kelch repeat-containing protein n=1 Tax=Aquimarina callyspongiae TaxID=3098150 RepID=UPI002AB5C76E|nr:kelch repeat-containing protein [Aquimarina sp. 2201CG5-10]MDY8137282.1 kelch repeat-containing protein [Aquimarina sp. 2201CG5-10]
MLKIIVIVVVFSTSQVFSQIVNNPCPRNQPVTAYHSKESKMFLFGGYCSIEKKRLNDFWVFDGETWKVIQTDIAPEPRSGHSMIYDSFKNRLLVFGGKNENGDILNDLWSWNGNKWKKLSESGPIPRQSHRMVFNSDNGDLFLFGGSNAQGLSLNDTWIFSNEIWIELKSKDVPPPRLQHTMAYDQQRKKVVLFGGFSKNGNDKFIYGDTWEWHIVKGWEISNKNNQLARDHHAMAYDVTSKRVILFGGYNQQYLGDTLSWNGEKWILIANEGPSKRAGKPALMYSVIDESLILFGGWDKSNKPLMDFWKFNPYSNHWDIYNKK